MQPGPGQEGRDPFNQNFRKFRSKTQWIGSVQPEKFRKTGPPFEVDHFSRSDRLEFWLNGSRPKRRRRREIRAKSGERLASRSTSASFAKADKTELNKQSKRKTSKIKARQNKFTTREMLEQLRREGDDTRCIWN